jgi:hypothetical protein
MSFTNFNVKPILPLIVTVAVVLLWLVSFALVESGNSSLISFFTSLLNRQIVTVCLF